MENHLKKPKICFITPFFYPVKGGVESHIYDVSKELIKLGYDIDVFTTDMDRDKRIKEKYEEIDKIKIHRFRNWLKISFAEMFFPRVFLEVAKSDADIFHVHTYRHLYNFITFFTKKPCVLTPHWPIYRGQRKLWQQYIIDFIDKFLGKIVFKKFTRIFTVTGLENKWVESFNVPKNKIVITPNALSNYFFKKYNKFQIRKKYNIKDKELIVLTLSRIHKSKGIDQLIKVAKHFPNVRFIIAGRDGGEELNLKKLAKSLKLENIIFAGELTDEERGYYYASADIFCSPSHYEGFCIDILEAMSQECAVITSNQGGMPWVVGNNGLIFEDYNLQDLKKKLDRLVKDKKLREQFQKKGYQRSKEFRWETIVKILDKEYKKIMK